MTRESFKARIKELGFTQARAANALGVHLRTVKRYAAGDLPISRVVELALDGLAAKGNDHAGD